MGFLDGGSGRLSGATGATGEFWGVVARVCPEKKKLFLGHKYLTKGKTPKELQTSYQELAKETQISHQERVKEERNSYQEQLEQRRTFYQERIVVMENFSNERIKTADARASTIIGATQAGRLDFLFGDSIFAHILTAQKEQKPCCCLSASCSLYTNHH